MKLVIAEKPSVAQSIAMVIGADKREDGYLEGNGYLVSRCVGHLVELAPPLLANLRSNNVCYLSNKPLLELFESYETYVKAWNPERETEYGLFRIPIPEFDWAAFREGLVNAFCHRDYTMLGSVRVLIDDEGMTISNPGGFIDGAATKWIYVC